MNKSSFETTPSSNNVALVGSVDSGSALNQELRRSSRLSLRRKIDFVSLENGEEASEHYDKEIKRTKTVDSQPLSGLDVEVLGNESGPKEVLVDDNENTDIDVMKDVINGTVNVDRSRFTVEEKGKGKVREAVDQVIDLSDLLENDSTDMDYSDSDSASDVIPEQKMFMDNRRPASAADMERITRKREMFKNIARKKASKFAYFSVQEEDDEDEIEHPMKDADWTGPISSALKIIRDRVKNMARQKIATPKKNESVPLWVPKENKERERMKKVAPSLQDLCIEIMVENADAITSLESVPDELRHKLSHLLCKSRKMNHHFLDLLASGSPSEIRVRDCSWLNEDQLTKTLEKADTSKLTVLQVDQCGRCIPDYVILTTLTNLPSKFSALTNISLKGACRLSNAGLDTLVSSTPALRSINLGCCSLLTCDGIITLADKLGTILKELYIDECFGIVDANSILPALLKLQQLEVLSISHFETVNDSFVIKFVTAQGQKMKELILADCTKLTDKAVKAIAENCPRLCVIDLTNLRKLTDNALGHLANGCQSIQSMKFQRNAFSDEFVAAYLEARGRPLRELSLNHVDKVGHQTAISLAKHAIDLHSLDLSWCREITDEALGLIVDSCFSLKILKLFGCTQITEIFMNGHSNEQVKVVGLKESSILKNIEVPDFLPLKYSAV